MPRPKVYENDAEKQKAYRDRTTARKEGLKAGLYALFDSLDQREADIIDGETGDRLHKDPVETIEELYPVTSGSFLHLSDWHWVVYSAEGFFLIEHAETGDQSYLWSFPKQELRAESKRIDD